MNRLTLTAQPVPFVLLVAAMTTGVVLPVGQPARAASRGECVTALVDAPFRLPDGLLYPAGSLTLCDYGAFSPIDTLHRILVGGSSVGLFRSRRRSAEAGSMASPEVVFNRDADGNLELIGYATPSAGQVLSYRMQPRDQAWQAMARQRNRGSSAPLAAIVATARGR
jgi:hypothetical protein